MFRRQDLFRLWAADYNTVAVMVFFLASAAEKVNAEAVLVLALILAFIGGLLVARKNA